MTRSNLLSSLVILMLASVACDLVVDFNETKSWPAGAGAGGKNNQGGHAGTAGNVSGIEVGTAGATSTTMVLSGGAAGTGIETNASGGTAGTSWQTTNLQGGLSPGGAAAGGTMSAVAGGPTTLGGAANGGTATLGGAATTGGATSKGGTTATGGVTTTGGTVAAGGTAAGGSSGDTTPPTVTLVTPANGTKGVLSNSTITINFSEAMNTSSTASAISVSGLMASDFNLAWNSAATSVTLTPTGGLVYATGNSPGTPAKSYTVTVGTAARDVAGNAMTSATTSKFTTLTRITYVMSPSLEYQVDTLQEVRTACANSLKIGGWSATYSGGDYYSYMVFDLSAAGSPSSMYSIESAKLYATQTADTANFYAKPAHVEVWRLGYDGSMNLSVFPILADIGALASAATPAAVSIDTLSSFKTDFVSNGATGLLFKLAPVASTAWVSEQTANFTCSGFHLDMIYLMQ